MPKAVQMETKGGMVIYVMEWDLPTQKTYLEVYANKARNDWIPFTEDHPGVKAVRTFRNPMEATPQVSVMIEFSSLDSWRSYIESPNYMRLMREIRILGCQNFSMRVWSQWDMGHSQQPNRP